MTVHYAQAGWHQTSCGLVVRTKKRELAVSTRGDLVDCRRCRSGRVEYRDAKRNREAAAVASARASVIQKDQW